MTMKTPEQIAAAIVNDNTAPDEWSPVLMSEVAGLAAAAIEADRAQRAELLEREAGILDGYRRKLPDSADYDLIHNMGRASEAMRLAAGWDATRAFQESHR